jgi:hypothetical protein
MNILLYLPFVLILYVICVENNITYISYILKYTPIIVTSDHEMKPKSIA